MNDKLQRRGFLAGTLATGLGVSGCEAIKSEGDEAEPAREYYERAPTRLPPQTKRR